MSDGRGPAAAGGSRERILASAAHTFATYGFQKSTFEEIAAGAGVSRTLLYSHFANKVSLLRAVRDRALEEWATSVEHAVEQRHSARGELEALVGETLRFATTHPIFRAFLSGDSRVALHGDAQGGPRSRDAWRKQTAGILKRGVKVGEFASDLDVRAGADVLCAMQLGVIEQMHHDADVGVVFGPAHVAAACHILIGGVVRPLAAPSESEVVA